MEVTNRLKGLDVIDRVPEELRTEVCNIVQEAVTKTIPKKKCKKVKQLSEEALQTAEKRREAKGKREKERYTHLNAEFQKIAKTHKASLRSRHFMGNRWRNSGNSVRLYFEGLQNHCRW